MKTLYAACLSRLGLSQADAAYYHDVSLGTIKRWFSGRGEPPAGVWVELRELEIEISEQVRDDLITRAARFLTGEEDD